MWAYPPTRRARQQDADHPGEPSSRGHLGEEGQDHQVRQDCWRQASPRPDCRPAPAGWLGLARDMSPTSPPPAVWTRPRRDRLHYDLARRAVLPMSKTDLEGHGRCSTTPRRDRSPTSPSSLPPRGCQPRGPEPHRARDPQPRTPTTPTAQRDHRDQRHPQTFLPAITTHQRKIRRPQPHAPCTNQLSQLQGIFMERDSNGVAVLPVEFQRPAASCPRAWSFTHLPLRRR